MKYTLTYCKNDTEIKFSEKTDPKAGKPYEYSFCSIRVSEIDEWINGFSSDTTKKWETQLLAMDEDKRKIDIDVHVYDKKKGEKTYKNFKFLSEKDKLSLENEELKKQLAEQKALTVGVAVPTPTAPVPTAEVEVPNNPNATVEEKEQHVETKPTGIDF